MTRDRKTFWWMISLLLALLPAVACGQPDCEQWRDMDGGVPGVTGSFTGSVNTMTLWDPDGPGPRSALVVVGGLFTAAGYVVANNIAAWDGTSWQSLGTGSANGVNGQVNALTVYNGRLIAGGSFTQAGGQTANYIAAWDGTSWQPLGTGAANGVGNNINALTVYNGRLIAGGQFTQAGGQAANRIALWDGTSWQSLGTGSANGVGDRINSLAVYNGRLISGGQFTQAGGQTANRIAAWNGTSWQPLGTGAANGVGNNINALTVYNGRLIAGGSFTQAGGQTAFYIAAWDGTSWQPLGAGAANGVNSTVLSLTVYNGRLIAGGGFTQAGGQTANNIAAWDGTSWQSLGTGAANGVGNLVWSLTVYNGRLIAGGDFTQAGGQTANYIAAWDGTSWQQLGSGAANGVNNFVRALTVYNGRLIAGGDFLQAGGQTANYIAAWDGTSWQPLGTGAANGVNSLVRSLTVYNGRLIAGGDFTLAGGQTANRVAAWDGTSWQSLGTGTANGVSIGRVYSLTVYNGRLIAGGDFTQVGGQSAKSVAAWDGTSWQPLGAGAANGVNNVLASLTVYNGRLIAGGFFTQAGGQTANRIAAWDGTSWQPLGTGAANGVSLNVRSLTLYNGRLIAGGDFTQAGGQTANRIAAWDGTSWQPLGTGVNNSVIALTVYNGRLIAGGIFTLAGGQTANNIAAWDGTSWQTLGAGADSNVNALSPFDPDGLGPGLPMLVAGGAFGTAGGDVSPFFAVWGTPTDSAWSAPAGGNAALFTNWACSAPPDAQQTILFDRVAAGVNLNPAYTITTTAPITAKRLTANTDQVTLNLSGKAVTLAGPASDLSPPLVIGQRSGAPTGYDARLLLRNTASNPAATFTAGGVLIGGVTDTTNNALLSVRDSTLTAQINGSVSIGTLSKGTLEVRDGATFRYGADPNNYFGLGLFAAGPGVTSGTLNVFNAGKVQSVMPLRVLSLGSAVGATSTVSLTGAGTQWSTAQNDLYVGDQGATNVSITGGAQWLTSSSNSVIVGRATTSSASVTIGAGSLWQESLQAINVGGAGGSSTATITVQAGGTLQASSINLFKGGTLQGSGTVSGDVFNLGTIRPGQSPGVLTVDGDYRQIGVLPGAGTNSGTLVMEVAGTTPGTQHDQLVINGAAELAGGLQVQFLNGFVPPPNGNLELVTATSATGSSNFDVAVLPALNDGRFLRVDYGTARGPGGRGGAGFSVRLAAAPLGAGADIGPPQTAGVGGSPTNAVVADFNGDGNEDLAITVPAVNATGAPGSVVVLFSAGHDTAGNWLGFAGQQTITVQNEPLGLDAGDLNGDGKPDLAVANSSSNSVSVLLNSGGGTVFPSTITVPSVGTRPVALAIANIDTDPSTSETLPEIAVACQTSNEVRVLRSSAGGTAYATAIGGVVALPAGSAILPGGTICAVDPDQDKNLRRRRLGVALAGLNSIVVINNTASARGPGLSLVLGTPVPVGPSPAQILGVNLRPAPNTPQQPNIGNADLVVRNSDGTLSVLLGDTQMPATLAAFRPAVSVPVSTSVLSISALDVDTDGDPDLAALTPGGANTQVQIIRNDFLTRAPNGVISQSNAQPVLVPNAVPSLVGGALAKIVVSGKLSGVASAPADIATIADPPPPFLTGDRTDAERLLIGAGTLSRGTPALTNVRGFPNRRTSSTPCNPADICGVGATYDNGAVDIGPDQQLTIEDFLNFLSAFGDSTGCPGTARCNPADICGVGATYDNGAVDIGPDGDLTIEDFLNFLSAFGDATGCP